MTTYYQVLDRKMKGGSMKTHYQNLSQPQKTACGRFWALQYRGSITIIGDAVDDWKFVTCKNCLKKKPEII